MHNMYVYNIQWTLDYFHRIIHTHTHTHTHVFMMMGALAQGLFMFHCRDDFLLSAVVINRWRSYDAYFVRLLLRSVGVCFMESCSSQNYWTRGISRLHGPCPHAQYIQRWLRCCDMCYFIYIYTYIYNYVYMYLYICMHIMWVSVYVCKYVFVHMYN